MSTLPSYVEPVGDGIYAIDTDFHRPRFDAAWLLVENGRAAFVDTGTNFGVPRLLGALEALGLPRDAVDLVIPTHVHLDHAGGVGALMRELPAATCWIHPRGARHLVDPSLLVAGATAVYGPAEMARSYGTIVPVAKHRVRHSADGLTIALAGRPLTFLDTPGHARHHHCIWDERTRGFFTGDTFGLSYREFDTAAGAWALPSSTPVQFEPDALRESIERLLAYAPQAIYLTHYGAVRDVPRLGRLLLDQLEAMVAIGRAAQGTPDRDARLRRELRELYVGGALRHGCAMPRERIAELLALDVELNAQGVGVWLDKQAREAAKAAA